MSNRRFQFKILKGGKKEVIEQANKYSQTMLDNKFSLVDISWLVQKGDAYIALILFESSHSNITFSKSAKIKLALISEKGIEELEESLNCSLQEMEAEKYYPTRFKLLEDSVELSVSLEYRHSNLSFSD